MWLRRCAQPCESRFRTRCRVSELRFDAIGRIGTRTRIRVCPSAVLSARTYMDTRRAGRRSGRSSGSRPGRTRGKDYRRIQGGHRAWAAGSERTRSAGSSPSGSGRAGRGLPAWRQFLSVQVPGILAVDCLHGGAIFLRRGIGMDGCLGNRQAAAAGGLVVGWSSQRREIRGAISGQDVHESKDLCLCPGDPLARFASGVFAGVGVCWMSASVPPGQAGESDPRPCAGPRLGRGLQRRDHRPGPGGPGALSGSIQTPGWSG